MKCETPARESVSSREPAPIQKPRATERTPGTRSEMTRSPLRSSVSWCFDTPRDGIPRPSPSDGPVSVSRKVGTSGTDPNSSLTAERKWAVRCRARSASGERNHPQGGCRRSVTADGQPRNGRGATPADQGVAVMRKPAAILLVLSLAVLALALVPAAGLAAKGGGGGNSTAGGGKPGGGGSTGGGISGPLMLTDTNTPGLSRGDLVTFNV